MAEIKGYIYEEIKNLANNKRCAAQQRVEDKYEKELEQVKQEAEKEITPEVLKVAQIKVSLESYGNLNLDVRIPKDKKKSFEEKYGKLFIVSFLRGATVNDLRAKANEIMRREKMKIDYCPK